ncbi:hypothetical protein V8G54_037051 [Vigna mungo]|uniref:Uncharacterized protein n=1 Tax=Vigna mungo TaxID=3915 RepID=A0AAQ3MI42_VIGMU
MAASSSRSGKPSAPAVREANPSGWIGDESARERFLRLRMFKKGLDTFPQIKGDCYLELVEVFYNNVKEVDENIHSQVKGDCMRYRGRYRKKKRFLFKWLDKEEKVVAFIIGHILLPGRPNLIKLTPRDRIPTNWVALFKWHILDVGINNWHMLPYGVFISTVLEKSGVNLSGEKKLTRSKANLIRKATLTSIGLKKTALGWYFRYEVDSTKGKETLLDSDSDQEFPPLNSEFEKRIFKHYVDISTSSEESVREDVDDISEESSTESSESE